VLDTGKLRGSPGPETSGPNRTSPELPNPEVPTRRCPTRRCPTRRCSLRVASLAEKENLLAANPEEFFTEPQYDGFPAVLVRLPTPESWRS
jgi:hypothetical protein